MENHISLCDFQPVLPPPLPLPALDEIHSVLFLILLGDILLEDFLELLEEESIVSRMSVRYFLGGRVGL